MRAFRAMKSLDAHHRLLLALLVGSSIFLLLARRVDEATRLVAVWDGFALTEVGFAWWTIISSDTDQIRRTAQRQDVSRTIMFIMIVIGAGISLLAVGLLLGPSQSVDRENLIGHILLSAFAVASSWLIVHTVFTLHYAHRYYQTTKHKPHEGGLAFPEEPEPDYLDFAYFSLVIGMTCQVSDVQITARTMRHLTLLHGVLSFAFNTVILALMVNLIAGLL